MLGTLIESGAVRTKKPLASLMSVGVHVGLITLAVAATEQVHEAVSAPVAEYVEFVAPKTPPAPTVTPVAAQIIPRGFSVVVAPVTIPDVLPPIDLTRAITDPGDYTGVGVPGGRPDGVVGAPGVYRAEEVERIAQLVPGTATPQYPDALRSARIEGDVVLEFVIDVDGRADPRTIKVVSSNHKLFADAALRALGKARFVPAELDGRRVPQLVRMPMAFKLRT